MKKVDNNLSTSYEIVKVFIQKVDNLMKRKRYCFVVLLKKEILECLNNLNEKVR